MIKKHCFFQSILDATGFQLYIITCIESPPPFQESFQVRNEKDFMCVAVRGNLFRWHGKGCQDHVEER